MNENPMTFEELVDYAQEAKEQKEKERLAAKKNEACIDIIKKIIDRLKAKKGETAKVKQFGTNWIIIDNVEDEVEVVITLDDIKEVIDKIPALEARLTELCRGITVLEVTFSETKATEMLETDGNEDK